MKPLSLVCLTLVLAPLVCIAVEPRPTVPEGVGVNIHFTDPRPGEMKLLAASGVRWVRMDFKWSSTETAKGQYNFAAYDRLVAALDQYNIRAIFILDYANKFYDNGLSPQTDEAINAFARWAAAAARHFKGHGILWEIYNEPNGSFWRPKPNVAPYKKLALAVGAAIHQAVPGEESIGPAINSFDLGWMKECFKAGLLNYWSAVSVHGYRDTAPETATTDFQALNALIQRYAPKRKQIPIISGEWGYASVPGQFGGDEAKQAKFLARQWLNNLANGVAVSIWYDWHDDCRDPASRECHAGIVNYNYGLKPAYYAAQTLTTKLNGYRFNKRLSVGRAEDYILMFSKGSAAYFAAWTTDAPHPVVIPVGHSKNLSVTLTDSPQYLQSQ